MLGTLSPLGERSRGNSWRVTSASYVLGNVLAGTAVGAFAAVVGSMFTMAGLSLPAPAAISGLAILTLAGVVWDTGAIRYRLPSTRRQVNDTWTNEYKGWAYGFAFGLQLGAGVLTIVKSTAVYLLLVAALLCGNVALGAVIGGTFGLVRGLSLLLARGSDTWGSSMVLDRRLLRLERPTRLANRLVLTVAAIAILAH